MRKSFSAQMIASVNEKERMIFSARFRYHHWASYIIAGGPDNDGSASLNIEVKVSVSNSGWCTLLCNISLLIGW